tara:strand:+ start:2440 stop:2541 length:102 start_codon:yes stop_codon:yes gene_type:complete
VANMRKNEPHWYKMLRETEDKDMYGFSFKDEEE